MDLSIPDRLPASLQAAATVQDLVAGQVLFHRRDPALAIFAVVTGRLRLIRYTSEGRVVVLQIVRSGESFAESSIFFDVYGCDAVAEVPTRLIQYPQAVILAILREQPELTEQWMRHLATKHWLLKDRLELHNIRSARERLLQYLHNLLQPSEITITFDRPLKDVAIELGLTPEVFYRTLAQMQQEGIIIRHERQITLRLPT